MAAIVRFEMTCLFCGSEKLSEGQVHIVPESLGGPRSPVAPTGVTCDSCNQYFGQKVEAIALRSFPFADVRMLAGVPSKKGRFVEIPSTAGLLRWGGRPGLIELAPRAGGPGPVLASRNLGQLRTLAEVTEPLAVVRMLLKIGLEMLGKHFPETARSGRVAAAREFARRPRTGARWWCVLYVDSGGLLALDEKTDEEWSVEVSETEQRLVSILQLSTFRSMIPLEYDVSPPDAQDLPEPYYRLVSVQV